MCEFLVRCCKEGGAAFQAVEVVPPTYPRWEENESSAVANALAVVPAAPGAGALVAVFPKEVVLSGGIKVGKGGARCDSREGNS